MKKFLSILIATLVLISVTACAPKEQSVTMAISQNGIDVTYQLDAKGDIVHTLTQTSTIDCSGYSEAEKDMFLETLEEYKETYSQFLGVEYSTSSEGDFLSETIIIDISNKVTVQALADANLLPLEGDSNMISLEKTVQSLESQGWTKK